MKVVILAGGLGTRLSEVTDLRPKPMVEVGTQPILWHIMKHYSHFGFDDFYVALGYMGEVIKRYFFEYHALAGDLTVDLREGRIVPRTGASEDWRVNLVETGLHTNTGGRVHALADHLRDGPFMLTYGDGVCDVDLRALADFHRSHGLLATVTAVRPPARFGGLVLDGDKVTQFTEKPQIGEGWINGGFMVLQPEILDFLSGPEESFEIVALERAAGMGQLAAFRHDRFWQCMDTLRDLRLLESLWERGVAPWKVWRDG